MKTTLHFEAFGLALALAAGCGGSDQDVAKPAPASDTFADQVARGAELYGENCASCHGDAGQGSADAPPLVGEGALPLEPPPGAQHRTVQFRTALDVYQWVKEAMPADAPGSLTDGEYVDILAFDLKANGVELDAPLDAQTAAELVLHP